MYHYFYPHMHFAFGRTEGGFPLLNPHNFAGTPFFGSFQGAVLYPPNIVLYNALPLVRAINWSIALHVFMFGFFVFLWLGERGLSTVSRFAGSVICMFSGPFFYHQYAGHLSHITSIAWAPLILLAVEGIARRPGLKYALAGAAGVSMMIFGGHPQYLFCLFPVAGAYFIIRTAQGENRRKKLLAFAGMLAGGALLSAVQVFTFLSESGEGARSGGAAYEFASSFSLPPESLLTLFAPGFFGDAANVPTGEGL